MLKTHGKLKLQNQDVVVRVEDFEQIVKGFDGDLPVSLVPLVSLIIGENYYKRCCSNCQHSLMCRVKEVAIHEMLLKSEEFSCNLFMLNQ